MGVRRRECEGEGGREEVGEGGREEVGEGGREEVGEGGRGRGRGRGERKGEERERTRRGRARRARARGTWRGWREWEGGPSPVLVVLVVWVRRWEGAGDWEGAGGSGRDWEEWEGVGRGALRVACPSSSFLVVGKGRWLGALGVAATRGRWWWVVCGDLSASAVCRGREWEWWW